MWFEFTKNGMVFEFDDDDDMSVAMIDSERHLRIRHLV